jgi:SAM-dependent methyltransferase
LATVNSELSCELCGRTFPVADGIPRLYPRDDRLTIDPTQLRIKSRGEAAHTISEMNAIDHGFLTRHRSFYILYFLLILSAVFQIWWGVAAIALLLLCDWIVFRKRRGGALARHLFATPRLQSVADHQAVDELYEREGKPQPSMSDWVDLAHEAAGNVSDSGGSSVEDDERYLDIKRVYDRYPRHADVVADVGANDGRTTWKFGIGAGRSVVGIDVSHLLLKTFLQNLPGQTALQADGGCLPLEDACADFLLCTETLEHIPDPGAAVREFFRVLKPGGWLMIQSPNAHRLRNSNPFHILILLASLATDAVLQKKTVHENTWHNGITYHWDFSVQDYRSMIQTAGGSVMELRSAQFFIPRFLTRPGPVAYAAKEKAMSGIPLVRYLGADLVVVAAKLP